MLRSPLFQKNYLLIVTGVLLSALAVYLLSVPYIRSTVFEIEERNGRTVLDHIIQSAVHIHWDIDSQEKSSRAARKERLQEILTTTEYYLDSMQKEIEAGTLTRQQAQEKAREIIRDFRYGNNDYVWVTDYQLQGVVHPDSKYHGKDVSNVRDAKGTPIVAPIVKIATEQGDGYYSYWWNRLESPSEPEEKLTYVRNYPKWGWVLATGLYLNDIQEETLNYRLEEEQQLRELIHRSRIGESGYVYIFDSNFNMLMHPNANIEGQNVAELLNPLSGKPLAQELIAASRKADNRLIYKWDKPADPGNYVYDKISWVHHVPELDWYIASSVYIDELQQSSDLLKKRILGITALILVVTLIGAYLSLRGIVHPINALSKAASRVRNGDLSVTFKLERSDELGTLGAAFNAMVKRLKDQIDNLEIRVDERTTELTKSLDQLEHHNWEIAQVNRMGELLQLSHNQEENERVLTRSLGQLFPKDAGILFLTGSNGEHMLEPAVSWGSQLVDHDSFPRDECWALRLVQPNLADVGDMVTLCNYPIEPLPQGYLCQPMFAHGELIGLLHLQFGMGESAKESEEHPLLLEHRKRLAENVVERIALALANQKLQERLRQQSIRDPLTSLFNRRYLEESLKRELHRSKRRNDTLGVIMMDVDHFKQLNDTHGHEAGDEVLQRLAQLLMEQTRKEDITCRYGGEEFVIILPETPPEGCAQRAENLRSQIERGLQFEYNGKSIGPVTVSAGVAIYPTDGQSEQTLLHNADIALYQAKQNGRNLVATFSSSEKTGSNTNPAS